MDAKWLEQVKAKLEAKMAYGREMAKDIDFIPFTVKEGKWALSFQKGRFCLYFLLQKRKHWGIIAYYWNTVTTLERMFEIWLKSPKAKISSTLLSMKISQKAVSMPA